MLVKLFLLLIFITDLGHEVLASCAQQFIECLSRDPTNIAISWFSKSLISKEILQKTNELDEINSKKGCRLYTEAVNLVDQRPDMYQSIIESFEEQELFSDLRELLSTKYGKLCFTLISYDLVLICRCSERRKHGSRTNTTQCRYCSK